jgi:hypothetical protein
MSSRRDAAAISSFFEWADGKCVRATTIQPSDV